ncbi:MalY/PatB family protein [Pectinatus frisingensis]|uniref:MalY/PatB family protein n=1 Tax=Pectinatus frisingensis TaxID=865 RepID=UPI0018C830EC|nr:PatB family C-S lyase [Pectinatus frisingensis]
MTNFDEIIDRKNNFSAKYDELTEKFGRNDLIPLWIADMDFKTAAPISEALQKRAMQGIFGYTSRPQTYFKTVGSWLMQRHDWSADPKLMLHTPGVVTALSLLIRTLTCPGDKIIIQPPVYYPFFDVIAKNNRILVENPLKNIAGHYEMDYEQLEEKAKAGAKLLLLCSPHNPVGRVWKKDELIKLGNICLKYNIMVIADEIHCDITFNSHKHIPLASISEQFRQNTITCLSPSKTFNLAGLQASIVVFPNAGLKNTFAKVLDTLDLQRNNCFSLIAVEAAYQHGTKWLETALNYIENNFKFINEFCAKYIPAVKPNYPEGTYLVLLDCRKLGLDKKQLHNFMVNKAHLALDDGCWFSNSLSQYVRLNAACPRPILKKALYQLADATQQLNL